MKKKILAILLAVCLAVGCLPAPASAAQLTGSKEELSAFLKKFAYMYGFFDTNVGFPYDNVLHSFLVDPPYEDLALIFSLVTAQTPKRILSLFLTLSVNATEK